MANRYWVGGTGTWNTTSTTNWSATSGGASGASVPTAADSVFFDQAGTYTVTPSGTLLCLDITVSAGTVTFASGFAHTLAVSGSMSLIAGTVWSSTGGITFNATTTGKIVTTNGTSLSAGINFSGVGGGWSLGSALTTTATAGTSLTNGALTLNGFDLTTGTFSASVTNTRSIAFGSNNIILNASSGLVLSIGTATGFSWTGTGGFVSDASVIRTFTFGTTGGTSANAPNLTFTGSGTAIPVLTTGGWFNKLDFGTTAFTLAATTLNLNSLTLSSGGTFTGVTANMVGTGTITPNGKSIAAFTINNGAGTTTLAGALGCTTYTQTAGTIDFATFNLTCSSTATYTAGTLNNIGTISCTTWTCGGTFTLTQGTITPSTSFVVTGGFNYNGGTLSAVPTFTQTSGSVSFGQAYALTATGTYTLTLGTLTLNGFDLTTGIFSSAVAGVRSIAFGTNNIVLAHTTATTTVLNMTDVTSFTYTGTGGFVSDASVVRTFTFGTTGGSTTNAPNLTFTGSGTAIPVLTTGSWFNKLDFGTTAFTLAATTINLNSLTLSSGGTFTNLSASMRGTGSIVNNGNTTLGPLIINNGAGTTTLTSALNCTTYTQTAGTINFATFNLTCSGNATYTAGTLNNIGTISCVTWTCSGTFTMTSGTITPSTSFVVTGGFNYNGGTLSAVPTFTQTSGAVSFGQAYALTATGTYTLTAGTLTLNNYTLTTGIFSSSGTGVRSIAWGTTGKIVLNHTTAAQTVLNMAIITNFSSTGTTNFSTDMDVARTVVYGTTGGTNANGTNLTLTGTGSGGLTITGASWFNLLDLGSTTGGVTTTTSNFNNLTLSNSGSLGAFTYSGFSPIFAGTGTFTTNNVSSILSVTINCAGGTTTLVGNITSYNGGAAGYLTLTAGTLNLNNYTANFRGLVSSSATVRAIQFGSGFIDFGNSATAEVVTMSTATNFTYTATTGGFRVNNTTGKTFTFGSVAGGSIANAPPIYATASSGAIAFTANSWCSTLNCTAGTYTGSVSGTVYVQTLTLNTSGTHTGLNPIMSGTSTITTNGKAIGSLTVDAGVGGTTTLNGPVTFGTATAATTLTSGTLDLNGNNLTTGTFSSTNTNTRSISFGSNNIILATTTAATVNLSMATATGFTWSGTGGFTAAADITRTYTFGTTGGTETNAPKLTLTGSGTAVQTFTTGSCFNTVNFGTTAFTVPTTVLNVVSLSLTASCTFTGVTVGLIGTGSLTSNGKQIAGLTVNAPSSTATLADQTTFATATAVTTLTAGTLALNGFNLTTGTFSSTNTNTRSISFGSNNIILATTTLAATNLDMAVATGFTWSGTGGFTAAADITRTFTFGTTGGSSTNSVNLSFTGSGTAIQTLTTGSWFNILNFGTTAFALPTTALNVNTLTLSSGGTFTSLTPTLTATQTWTSQYSKQFAGMGFNAPGGTLTFSGSPGLATAPFTLTAGTLDLSGGNLTVGTFISSNTNTRSIAFGSNNIVLSTTTAAAVNLSMADLTGITYTGTGGFTAAADIARTFTVGTTAGNSAGAPSLTFTGSGSVVPTLTSGGYFGKLDFGTTTFDPGTTTLNVNSVTLSASGAYTLLTLTTIGTGTITANGKTIAALTINAPGGTTTLSGTLAYATATAATTLTAGTLDLNGTNLTTGTFSSSNSNTRSVTFGNNYIILAHTTAGTICLSMSTGTGFTSTGAGGFSTNMSVTRIMRFGTIGGTNANAPNLFITGGASEALITTGSWFNVLDFTGSTCTASGGTTGSATTLNVDTLTLATGGTYTNVTVQMTGTGTIVGNGKTIAALTIDHTGTTTITSALTVTGATTFGATLTPTLSLSGADLTTGSFASSFTTARTVAFGTNYIITTAGLSMSDATNFTYTGTGGFKANMTSAQTIVFGVTGGSASNAPDLYIYTGTGVATITAGSWFRKIDCTGTSCVVPTSSATARIINVNNLILSNGTYTSFTANMYGAGATISSTGGVLNTITIPDGGTVTLASEVGVGTYVQAANTTLDMATFAFTATTTIDYNGGTILNPGTISCTTFNANGTYTVSSGTLTASTSIVVTGGFNYTGGTLSATPLITHTSGNVTFGKSYALSATGTYTLTAGALDVGGFTLTTGIFSSSNTNVRSIAFGSGNIDLAHTTAGTLCLNIANMSGLTCTGTGGFTTNMSVTRNIRCGYTSGTIANAPNFSVTGGASEILITTGAIFNKLDFTGSTCTVSGATTATTTALNAASLTLATGGTYTNLSTMTLIATGTLTTNGKSLTTLAINHAGTTTLAGAVTCTTYTQTAGDVDFATFNMTCTNAAYYAGSLTNVGTITCNLWTCFGAFTMTNGTITPATSFVVNGGSFNYNGGTLSPVGTFTHTAGNVTFGKAYALTATGQYTLTAGTVDLGGFDLTTGVFSSSGTGVRSIAFGANNIVLSTTSVGATNLAMIDITNLTCTGTGGFTAAADITRSYSVGSTTGTIASAPKLTLTGSGTAVQTFTTGSFFDTLNFGTTAFTLPTASISVNSITLSSGGTFTGLTVVAAGAGTITTNGKTIAGFTVNALGKTVTLGGALTVTATTALTAGALVLNGFDLSTSIFSSTNSNVRSIAFGSNVIVLSSTATPLAMSNAVNFSCTGTGGFTCDASTSRTYTVGTTGAPTVAPNLTLIGSGTGIQTFTTGGYFGTLNFGTTAFTVAVTALNLYGLTLSAGGTFTNLTPTFIGTGTINGNGKTLPTLTLNHTGTTTLSGALTVTGATTFNSTPTLALGGQTLTTGSFSSTGTGARTITGSGTISVGNDWTVTTGSGFTGTGYSIKMTKATTKTFAGGGGTYGTLIQNGAGALTITGSNTFDDIQVL